MAADSLNDLARRCLEKLVSLGLDEDLAEHGDVTSLAVVPASQIDSATLVAREPGVLAGIETAQCVFLRVDSGLEWEGHVDDGAELEPGQSIATVSGSMRSILAAERLALNFLQRLCGIATITQRYKRAIDGLPCVVLDTRKTTPGWRHLEKYAVAVGGGVNHRIGLYDGILIKDNHIAAWKAHTGHSSLEEIVPYTREHARQSLWIEVEVDSLSQFEEIIETHPDIVLLDNMSSETMRRAVERRNEIAPHVKLEASGGITLDTIRAAAESGVDSISVGALTHSVRSLDIGLDHNAE